MADQKGDPKTGQHAEPDRNSQNEKGGQQEQQTPRRDPKTGEFEKGQNPQR